MPMSKEVADQSCLQMDQNTRSDLPMNREATDQSFPKLIKGDPNAQHNLWFQGAKL